MTRWIKRAAAGLLLVCAGAGVLATPHASAQPGRLCARADVWVNPLTYLQTCINMPGYPSSPSLP